MVRLFRMRRFLLICFCLGYFMSVAAGWPADPTLARLSFWVPPERLAAFSAAYQKKVAPILKQHGLLESSEPGRGTVEGIFSRLFEMDTPAEVVAKAQVLQEDPAWQEVLLELGETFGIAEASEQIRYDFRLYATPAGSGKRVTAGPGRGFWRTYDVTDGLATTDVRCIYQDREGNLWFGGHGGDLSRFDGQKFTTFTTADGLAGNNVFSIVQDSVGRLWFGTWSGVSRYDGKTFTNFTTKDGLAGNRVQSILLDSAGNMWFGTFGGTSRYDGQTFTNFTAEDGLATDNVWTALLDRKGNLWFSTWIGGVSRYDGKTFRTFTKEDGLADNQVNSIFEDQVGDLWFCSDGGGVNRYDGNEFTTFTTVDGLAHNRVHSIYQDSKGQMWFGTVAGLSRYDGRTFTTFTTADGLAHNLVTSTFEDQAGYLWFGMDSGGVSRYDRDHFITFTEKDGLPHNNVESMLQDQEGSLWFGTRNAGVIRYDGREFVVFTAKDGLAGNRVESILQDQEGNFWFCTQGAGVTRYDGRTFTSFTTQDGMPSNNVHSIFEDRAGHLWFGDWDGGGVSRYDGQAFTTFTTGDGFQANQVNSIYQDKAGILWFGTLGGGVSRYDGETWTTFTTIDGLGHNDVRTITQDRAGNLWFGTFGGGVSRYDGKEFITFTTKDGLGYNAVFSIFEDREGHLWFGTDGGIVTRYDGQVFQNLTRDDGLTGYSVKSITKDGKENYWFATRGGVTRYHPPVPSPPPVFIDAVVADRRYEGLDTVSVSSEVEQVAFEFHGISFKTRPDGMVYRYRLIGYDKDWKNTNARRVEYENLPKGNYTFEVLAVDRDLVYSEKPATVTLNVVPPFYLRASFLVPTVGGGTILLVAFIVVSVAYLKRRGQVLAYQRLAVQELHDARQMQMSLLPEGPPDIKGVEIAGRCLPANTVSGDFYDYVTLAENTPAIVLADVTGKSMKGAMNAVLSSGALHAEAKLGVSPAQMLWVLNRDLHGRFTDRTNCAMCLATLESDARMLRYANAGMPYPIARRGGEIFELESDGMPLGGFRNAEYHEIEFELRHGDVVVFFSDGVTESPSKTDTERLYMETDRLFSLIGDFDSDMDAQAMLDAIFADVQDFSGDTAQSDDITVVVVKVLQ